MVGLRAPAARATLGLGTGSIGATGLEEAQVGELLEGAVEAGVTFFDSARSYGEAETRIGRYLARFGDRVVRATKVGYGIEGTEDWTAPCITAGIDAALTRLRTPVLDVAFLHSCPIETLERGDVIEALQRAIDAGKVRSAGYSGDGDALTWAVESGAFTTVEASYSVLDRSNHAALHTAKSLGIVTVAKRILANAVWRHSARPEAFDTGQYWDRYQAFDFELEDPTATFIRFASFAEPIDIALIGTSRLPHLEQALAAARRGPLSPACRKHLDRRYEEVGPDWPAVI